MRRHLPSDPVPHFYPSRASLSNPSSASSSSVPLIFPPRCSAHFNTVKFLAVDRPQGDHTDFWQRVYPPSVFLPRNYASDFDALLVDCGYQRVFGNFNAHHPSWFSRAKCDRAAVRGEAVDGAINSLQFSVANQKTSLLASPPRAIPPRQISLIWVGISFPVPGKFHPRKFHPRKFHPRKIPPNNRLKGGVYLT